MRSLHTQPTGTVDSEVRAEEQESEAADLAAGYPPRRWRCDCGREHGRGHFQSVGVHRCLGCGYVGHSTVGALELIDRAMA